jgi:hypothetical protein
MYQISTITGSKTEEYFDFLTSLCRIRKIDALGVVTTLAGDGTKGFADGTGSTAQFNRPCGIAVDSVGSVIVADPLNHRIRKIAPNGIVSTIAGNGIPGSVDGPASSAQFNYPYGVAVDNQDNVSNLYEERMRLYWRYLMYFCSNDLD